MLLDPYGSSALLACALWSVLFSLLACYAVSAVTSVPARPDPTRPYLALPGRTLPAVPSQTKPDRTAPDTASPRLPCVARPNRTLTHRTSPCRALPALPRTATPSTA